jgi:hypothetical protein
MGTFSFDIWPMQDGRLARPPAGVESRIGIGYRGGHLDCAPAGVKMAFAVAARRLARVSIDKQGVLNVKHLEAMGFAV